MSLLEIFALYFAFMYLIVDAWIVYYISLFALFCLCFCMNINIYIFSYISIYAYYVNNTKFTSLLAVLAKPYEPKYESCKKAILLKSF